MSGPRTLPAHPTILLSACLPSSLSLLAIPLRCPSQSLLHTPYTKGRKENVAGGRRVSILGLHSLRAPRRSLLSKPPFLLPHTHSRHDFEAVPPWRSRRVKRRLSGSEGSPGMEEEMLWSRLLFLETEVRHFCRSGCDTAPHLHLPASSARRSSSRRVRTCFESADSGADLECGGHVRVQRRLRVRKLRHRSRHRVPSRRRRVHVDRTAQEENRTVKIELPLRYKFHSH